MSMSISNTEVVAAQQKVVTAQYEMGLTIATSVMPGAGEFVDLKAILTGVDPITGADLTLANRAVSVIGLLPFVSGKMLRKADGGCDLDNCFAAGTKVATPTGPKAIETI